MSDADHAARACQAPEIRMESITRRFGATLANDRVDLILRPASIHALIGENGAGKSTLMRILYGLLKPDAGRIRINGEDRTLTSPAQALAQGIGMIHQHFMLVPAMTVLENMALGAEGLRGLRSIPRERLARDLRRLFASYGFDLDPLARVDRLGVGGRQRVEIARMLYRGARVLICDEPTAVLAPPEVGAFFAILRRFRDEGRTVVFITHKLAEVMAVADRVTVLRRGRVVGTAAGDKIQRDDLVRMMMGEEQAAAASSAGTPRSAAPRTMPPGVVLEAADVTLDSPDGPPLLERIGFCLHAGEILGVAGVSGNGQRELAEIVAGRRRPTRGTLQVEGHCYDARTPLPTGRRPALIPEDRHSEGLIGDFRLWENLLLGRPRRPRFMRPYWYGHAAARAWARPLLRQFRIEPPTPEATAQALSGGNQQKLLCARAMTQESRILIACQPTRGIDLASTRFLHGMLRDFAHQGGSVLLISADLDEILALADRIAVIYRGRLTEAVHRAETDVETIGREMVGVAG